MIKWSEQDVIDAVRLAMEEAAAMPSPQQMVQQLMNEAQSGYHQMPDGTTMADEAMQ